MGNRHTPTDEKKGILKLDRVEEQSGHYLTDVLVPRYFARPKVGVDVHDREESCANFFQEVGRNGANSGVVQLHHVLLHLRFLVVKNREETIRGGKTKITTFFFRLQPA